MTANERRREGDGPGGAALGRQMIQTIRRPDFEGLISPGSSVTSRRMSFYIALFVWLLIAALLTVGVVMATKGAFLVLAIGTIAFIGAFIKWGCLIH